jgi:hypothetical protein
MLFNRFFGTILTGLVVLLLVGCSKKEKAPAEVELAHYPIHCLMGVVAKSGLEFDKEMTCDGDGSIKVVATEPITLRLYETGDVDIENARLIYRAKLRTEDVVGQVYLEMWCHFPGKGEAFSRALQSPISGSVDWTSQETPFFLKKGENPDNVKLNLVVDGKGTVWIDDIRLLTGSLQ